MTQDQDGQRPATGNVIRGEVIPDNEGNVVPPTVPMTRFQKVASVVGVAGPDGVAGQTEADGQGASRGRHAASEAPPEDVVAVRSPDAGEHDNWDDPDVTDPQDPTPADKTAEPDADAADAADEAPLADSGDLTFGSLLPEAAEFRTRWQQVQFRFVDDPRGSVIEAADVISQLTAQLEAAIAERQYALREKWGEGSADTESLRGTLLMYRAFLDQLIGSDGR